MEITVKNDTVFLAHRFNEPDNNYLIHYGVLGMKWGVRRYRNEDGTLTEEGRKRELKRLSKNGKVIISKGSDLMRVSTRSESDAKEDGKLYVTPDKKEHETYKRIMGTTDVLKTGKAYVQKYIVNNDLVIPSIRTQTKMERSLINDQASRKEMIESLMKKGMTRESAANVLKPINTGKEVLKRSPMLLLTPIAPAAPMVVFNELSYNKQRQLNLIRNSIGDVNNKTLNKTFESKLKEKGYNAYRDTNDRRAVGTKTATVVIEPTKNTKFVKSHEMTKEEYGRAYANDRINKNKKLSKDISFEELAKDGEKVFEQYREQYIINQANKEKRDAILNEFKQKETEKGA